MAISTVLDHFKTVKNWAAQHGAQAQLDILNFQLVLQCGGQQFRLYPLFPAKMGERLMHVTTLTDNVVGFGGWLPYRPYIARCSTDKLIFKQEVEAAGLLTPRRWLPDVQPDSDFILKRSQGSFGYDISGPFRASQPISQTAAPNPAGRGEIYAEQFVEGRMLKIWFWGRKAFFVHMQEYPLLEGDGQSVASELVARRVAEDVGATALLNMDVIERSLEFQGLKLGDVPSRGRRFWMDFRYGRTFQDRRRVQDENALLEVAGLCASQLDAMGVFVEATLFEVSPVALMSSVDAVLDTSNRLWWLEMNTNSILPHAGYDVILPYLFDQTHVPPSTRVMNGAQQSLAIR